MYRKVLKYVRQPTTWSCWAAGMASWLDVAPFGRRATQQELIDEYASIHFEFSNQHGRAAGNNIGAEIVYTRLRRAGPCRGMICLCPQL